MCLYLFHTNFILTVVFLFASGGLWRPNGITDHLKATSLAALAALATLATLAALVSNVFIFALHNFHPCYCLGLASGGLWRPNRVTGHLKATSQFEFTAVGSPAGRPRSQKTLTTCSNMPYTTFIPIILCLVWPLESSGGPQRPK